jgi:hypothetical protein
MKKNERERERERERELCLNNMTKASIKSTCIKTDLSMFLAGGSG